jgi:hypothetical protein
VRNVQSYPVTKLYPISITAVQQVIVISAPSRRVDADVGAECFLDKRVVPTLLAHHHPLTWNRGSPKPDVVAVPNAESHAMNYATSSLSESATTRIWEYMAHTPGVQTPVHRIPG